MNGWRLSFAQISIIDLPRLLLLLLPLVIHFVERIKVVRVRYKTYTIHDNNIQGQHYLSTSAVPFFIVGRRRWMVARLVCRSVDVVRLLWSWQGVQLNY